MSYLDYRKFYKVYEPMDFAREYVAKFNDMPYRHAHAYAIGAAQRSILLTMDVLLQIHHFCCMEDISAMTLLDGLPEDVFKSAEQEGGCKAEDAHALTADFVQEFNSYGRGNPLFHAAYMVGTLCRMSPFASDNLICALVLCNFYFISRGMPPVYFTGESISAMADAVQQFNINEDIFLILHTLETVAEQTFSAFKQNTCDI